MVDLNHQLLSRLRLRHLSLLSLIARHRKLSRVALEVRMGQPSITKALKDIEDIFGAQLFEREPGGLKPTEAGHAVLGYVATALADLSTTAQKLDAISAGLHGRVRLGIIPHAPESLLSDTLDYLLTQPQRVSVVVREGLTDDLVKALRVHELDLVIGRSVFESIEPDIVQEPIFEQSPQIVVTKGIFDRIAKRALDWSQLSQLDWILQPSNTPMRRTVDSIFTSAGVPPPVPVVETYAIRAIENALRALPNGITILANDMAQALAATGVCRPLPYQLQWSLPSICVLAPRAALERPTLAAVLAVIRASAKRLTLTHQLRQSADF